MDKSESVDRYLELVFRYQDDVNRIIVNAVSEHYTAEELTQIVMVKAWKSFETLRHPERSKAWVKAITRNVIREYMRKKKVYLSMADRRVFSDLEKQELRSIEIDILEAVVKKEDFDRVIEALDMLDPNTADIIRKYIIGGATLKEVAISKNMNYGTVREYYTRGMRRLRKIYFDLEKGGRR